MATIVRRGNKKWQARVRRLGQHLSRTFTSHEDAKRWAQAQEAEIERGTWASPVESRRTRFRDVVKEYRQNVAKPRDCPAELSRLTRIEEWFGHLRLDALTPAVLMRWRDVRLQEVSGSTVRRELALLGGLLTWVEKELLIPLPQNAASAIRAPREARGRDRRLVKDEEERLRAAMERRPVHSSGKKRTGSYMSGTRQPWVKLAFELALETAMRRGEMLAMKWKDVDLDARTIFLEHTKNGESRTVPLSTRAVDTLQRAHELRGIAGLRGANGKSSKVISLVGANRVLPISSAALSKGWNRAVERARHTYEEECAAANVEPDDRLLDLHFHDLRHEATSRLALKLSNVLELAAVTGHRELRMLQRYYHPKASDLARKLG